MHDLDASGLHLVDHRGVECRAAVEAIIAELRAMACAVLREGGITDDEIVLEVSEDMRHAGQGFGITVPLAPEALQRRDAVALLHAFKIGYEERFGRNLSALLVEVVSWRVCLVAPPSVGRSSSTMQGRRPARCSVRRWLSWRRPRPPDAQM